MALPAYCRCGRRHGSDRAQDKSATPDPGGAACGAAEVIPLVAVTNLARTLEKLQQRGLWVVGTAGEAEQEIYQQDLTGPLVMIMGAEGKHAPPHP